MVLKSIPAGSKLRVLVVDDSVVARRQVTQALSADPQIEVVGNAASGSIALQMIRHVNPNVVMLDIEMPEMDGLETFGLIRSRYPQICVIICSTLTERGALATMKALSLGADDYVTKGLYTGNLEKSMLRLQAELLPKLHQFFRFDSAPAPKNSEKLSKPAPSPSSHIKRQAVVIGVSTGGPTALARIVPQFPKGFPLPVLLVQHMPPVFTRQLAQRLDTLTNLTVREATEGMPVLPGHMLVAPGNFHLGVKRNGSDMVATLNDGMPENSCRPAADALFRSACEAWGGGCIAAVLTGMGNDGLRGSEQLRGAGGYVIAQDEGSSVVWGMPGAVAHAGLADAILPLDEIVPAILRQMGQ